MSGAWHRRGQQGGAGARFTDIALVVVWRAGRVLVAPRPRGTHLEGLWEFPGGKIREGEAPVAAARRELEEETGLRGGSSEPLLVFLHDYGDRTLRFHCYLVRDPEGEAGGRWSWVEANRLAELPMPPANGAILRALRWRFGARAGRAP